MFGVKDTTTHCRHSFKPKNWTDYLPSLHLKLSFSASFGTFPLLTLLSSFPLLSQEFSNVSLPTDTFCLPEHINPSPMHMPYTSLSPARCIHPSPQTLAHSTIFLSWNSVFRCSGKALYLPTPSDLQLIHHHTLTSLSCCCSFLSGKQQLLNNCSEEEIFNAYEMHFPSPSPWNVILSS